MEYGSNIQKSLTLQSTQSHSRMRIVKRSLRSTGSQNKLKIGRASEVLSRRLNTFSLTQKFKRF